jgi:hypothetical protein
MDLNAKSTNLFVPEKSGSKEEGPERKIKNALAFPILAYWRPLG